MSQAATVDNVYVAQNDDDFQEAPLSQNGEIFQARLSIRFVAYLFIYLFRLIFSLRRIDYGISKRRWCSRGNCGHLVLVYDHDVVPSCSSMGCASVGSHRRFDNCRLCSFCGDEIRSHVRKTHLGDASLFV